MASLHDFGRREGAARRERRERRRAGASGSLDIKRVRTREACAGPYAPHARILANTCTRERELRCVALGSCSLRVQRARRSKAPPRGWRRWCGVGASRSPPTRPWTVRRCVCMHVWGVLSAAKRASRDVSGSSGRMAPLHGRRERVCGCAGWRIRRLERHAARWRVARGAAAGPSASHTPKLLQQLFVDHSQCLRLPARSGSTRFEAVTPSRRTDGEPA